MDGCQTAGRCWGSAAKQSCEQVELASLKVKQVNTIYKMLLEKHLRCGLGKGWWTHGACFWHNADP